MASGRRISETAQEFVGLCESDGGGEQTTSARWLSGPLPSVRGCRGIRCRWPVAGHSQQLAGAPVRETVQGPDPRRLIGGGEVEGLFDDAPEERLRRQVLLQR